MYLCFGKNRSLNFNSMIRIFFPGALCFSFLLLSCVTPKNILKLSKVKVEGQHAFIQYKLSPQATNDFTVRYLGSGGLQITKDGESILIDPFFSHQRIGKLGTSLLGLQQNGNRKLKSDQKMIDIGLNKINEAPGGRENILAVLSSHSHYDHLMDIPAIWKALDKKPIVLLNESGNFTCTYVIDSTSRIVLEKYSSTKDNTRQPFELVTKQKKRIKIYPILSEHNPHLRYIKFFSGRKTESIPYYNDPYQKTKANDWLEGNTFSFLIDYVSDNGEIELRLFIQPSSGNPPAGIPFTLLSERKVDVAFLGIASYQFSPAYPCTIFDAAHPSAVVWIHWEDFFRRYTRKPKMVRGTDVPAFFEKECVDAFEKRKILPWPGAAIHFQY
jgi:hypothetical protein